MTHVFFLFRPGLYVVGISKCRDKMAVHEFIAPLNLERLRLDFDFQFILKAINIRLIFHLCSVQFNPEHATVDIDPLCRRYR